MILLIIGLVCLGFGFLFISGTNSLKDNNEENY